MTISASDLPYDVKQQILKQIEKQVGSTEYYRIVTTVGEDGLIDLALKHMEETTKSQPNPKNKRFWKRHEEKLLASFFVLWLVVGLIAEAVYETKLILGALVVTFTFLKVIVSISAWCAKNMRIFR